jgi:hypothetical protein
VNLQHPSQEGVVKGICVGWGEARTPPEPAGNGGVRKLTPPYKDFCDTLLRERGSKKGCLIASVLFEERKFNGLYHPSFLIKFRLLAANLIVFF